MRSAFALRIISGKNILFVNRENLRIFPIYFFTGGVVEENGICNSDRTFNHCSPSVKIAFGALRRARQTRNKNNHSAEYVQSAAEHILNRPTPRQGLLFKNPYDTQVG